MLRLATIFAAVALTLTACSAQPDDFGTPPEQLENISVSGSLGESGALTGPLAVTGSGQDFVLTMSEDSMERTVKVHSPGKSDLSLLDGKAVTVELGSLDWGEPSLLIRDDVGVVYYAYTGSGVEGALEAGVPFVEYGEPVARVTDPGDDYDVLWEYTPVLFHTDEGDTSLLPGEVKSIRHRGQTFRAAAVAAYDVDYDGSGEVNCGPTSLLSFELLRVDAPPPALELVRPAHLPAATRSCGP